MKKIIKNLLILPAFTFPLISAACSDPAIQKDDLNTRTFSNPEATEKYQLLKEMLEIPLAIEKNPIAEYYFSALISQYYEDSLIYPGLNPLLFQRFLYNEQKDIILKKIEQFAKDPDFPEYVRKNYQGTSYLSASEFLKKWRPSQEKYLKSTNLKANPDFIMQDYGAGFSVNNIDLDESYLYYKLVSSYAKFYLNEIFPKQKNNNIPISPNQIDPNVLAQALKNLPQNQDGQDESDRQSQDQNQSEDEDANKESNSSQGNSKKPKSKEAQAVEQKDEKEVKNEKQAIQIPIPRGALARIVDTIREATTQPLSNAYWWNYNYRQLKELEVQKRREINDISNPDNLKLPLINDKDFQKKLELMTKLEKFTITGKDGRKYKVQPRAFFLVDDKTFADDKENKIKSAIYRLYWIVDSNPDSEINNGDKSIEPEQNPDLNRKDPFEEQPNLPKLGPHLPQNQNSYAKPVNFAAYDNGKLKKNDQQNPQPKVEKEEKEEKKPPIVQGPSPKPQKIENIGLVNDFYKYKFNDKIHKFEPTEYYKNTANFSQGGLYSANLLELEEEIKKQDPDNPKIFYVQRRIDIGGFLTKGTLLPFQPANLENNLSSLSLFDRYSQFLRSGRFDNNYYIIGSDKVEEFDKLKR
ncbi:hypothetical protein CIB43_00766 [Mesomycoplasma hyopneumoniae]|uniref:Lipoprotein n=1 Tax=Mesomycoplasma hyopneumoniae TaxID=2099 RepID=A0A223MAQ9_MESHO|nr:hypothetical protein CIB43_00766 [Mesomycoplasma hyopneumoniae]